jgi:hypothetical protein
MGGNNGFSLKISSANKLNRFVYNNQYLADTFPRFNYLHLKNCRVGSKIHFGEFQEARFEYFGFGWIADFDIGDGSRVWKSQEILC